MYTKRYDYLTAPRGGVLNPTANEKTIDITLVENKRNILLILSYDGTDFYGWQRQDENGIINARRTVQGEIEKALEKIHKHPVALSGSGRTDSGVHAKAQAAHFFTDIAGMQDVRFVPALNSLLPQDVRVMEARQVPLDFHARFSALSRTYRYFFIPQRQALATENRYAVQLWRQPDISILNDYCSYLKGEFDCTVFASPQDKSISRFRFIHKAHFFTKDNFFVFEITANAFLWKMVRSIAGTLLFYEEKKTNPEDFFTIIKSGKRNLAGPTLPPQGLFLWNVEYGELAASGVL